MPERIQAGQRVRVRELPSGAWAAAVSGRAGVVRRVGKASDGEDEFLIQPDDFSARAGWWWLRESEVEAVEESINPGIRRTVALLQEHGFETCDSGDGETHDHPCDRDHGYVAATCDPARIVDETHRLVALLKSVGVEVVPVGFEPLPTGQAHVQATYLPASGLGLLEVEFIHDRDLSPEKS